MLTNEQKLDEIYQIVKAQESRIKRAGWMRLVRIILILAIAYFVFTNPGLIISKITEIMMPAIMENMKTALENDTGWIMKQIQDILPKQ
jgi:hypothetical protein